MPPSVIFFIPSILLSAKNGSNKLFLRLHDVTFSWYRFILTGRSYQFFKHTVFNRHCISNASNLLLCIIIHSMFMALHNFLCLVTYSFDEVIPPYWQPISHKDTRLSLLYQYFYGKCSEKLHSLVSLVQTFTPKTFHSMYTGMSSFHSYSIRQLLSKSCRLVEWSPKRRLNWLL